MFLMLHVYMCTSSSSYSFFSACTQEWYRPQETGALQSTPPPLSCTVCLGPCTKISVVYTAMITEEPPLHLQEQFVALPCLCITWLMHYVCMKLTNTSALWLSCQQARLYGMGNFYLLCKLGSMFSFVTHVLLGGFQSVIHGCCGCAQRTAK